MAHENPCRFFLKLVFCIGGVIELDVATKGIAYVVGCHREIASAASIRNFHQVGFNCKGGYNGMRQGNQLATLGKLIEFIVLGQVSVYYNNVTNFYISSIIAYATVSTQGYFSVPFIDEIESDIAVLGAIGSNNLRNNTRGIHALGSCAGLDGFNGLCHGVRIVLSARGVGVGSLRDSHVLGDNITVVIVGEGDDTFAGSTFVYSGGESHGIARGGGIDFSFANPIHFL